MDGNKLAVTLHTLTAVVLKQCKYKTNHPISNKQPLIDDRKYSKTLPQKRGIQNIREHHII